jgi:hypothetical protein
LEKEGIDMFEARMMDRYERFIEGRMEMMIFYTDGMRRVF